MGDKSGVPALLESTQAALNVTRDGVLLILLLLLLFVPAKINDVLTKAGFTSLSMFGFDWESKLESAQKDTESAKQEVEKLNGQLNAYASHVEEVARHITQPNERSRAVQIAGELRAAQSSTKQIGDRLNRNLDVQRQMQTEFRKKYPAGQ